MHLLSWMMDSVSVNNSITYENWSKFFNTVYIASLCFGILVKDCLLFILQKRFRMIIDTRYMMVSSNFPENQSVIFIYPVLSLNSVFPFYTTLLFLELGVEGSGYSI